MLLRPPGAPGVARGGLTVPASDVPMIPPSVPAPDEPAPGSLEMPSIGSKGHDVGDCTPCAFLHANGCNNGALCKFCHLCLPGEKKRSLQVGAGVPGIDWHVKINFVSLNRGCDLRQPMQELTTTHSRTPGVQACELTVVRRYG